MLRCSCLLLLLAAAGCSSDDPMDRPGTWRIGEPSANDDNLRAMIVNPHDLVMGAGERTAVGAEAAAPVRRLLSGHRTPLPQSSASQISVFNPPPQPAEGAADVGQ
jgi:type IV pilus biogenesis protein CpaD/CtpE